jgi:large subunit ribosomal protein L24
MSLSRIRKNDTVTIRVGVQAGKTGKVLMVLPARGRALVEGLNLVKRHTRKSQEHPKGVIAEKEAPIPLAKLMPYCPSCKRGVRMKMAPEAEKTIRKCRRCGYHFDG